MDDVGENQETGSYFSLSLVPPSPLVSIFSISLKPVVKVAGALEAPNTPRLASSSTEVELVHEVVEVALYHIRVVYIASGLSQ